jgi:hypothetical protein
LDQWVQLAQNFTIRSGGEFVYKDRQSISGGGIRTVPLGWFNQGYEYGLVIVCDAQCTGVNADVIDGATGARGAAIPCPDASCFSGTPAGLTNSRGVALSVYPPTNMRPYSAEVNMSGCLDDPCEVQIYVMRGVLKATAPPVATPTPVPVAPYLASSMQFSMQPNNDPNTMAYDMWVSGDVRSAYGQSAYVLVNFEFFDTRTGSWADVKAQPASGWADNSGLVATWRNFVAQDPMDLSTLNLPMRLPYTEMNMVCGGYNYQMRATAKLFVSGTLIATAPVSGFNYGC